MLGIGIDTGGTCTDAVVYDLKEKRILAFDKAMTTHENLEIGIGEALHKLPRHLLEQASYLSLSTTLATNACVENKGGRVCLIFIGVNPKTVLENYKKYGFESTEFIRFLAADPAKGIAPNWEELDACLPEILKQYDGIAIAQIEPRQNNGMYEKEARARILAAKKIPVVCAYEIFKDLNVLKRGAGALLNVRLMPVIEAFFAAVHQVLEKENLSLPFFIMRSDGSLVSEQYSMQYPVETLLCGPTASVKGAAELLQEQNAVVIDMGGTTSDVALIRNGMPLIDSDGVKVGSWQTFVRGIDIDTFALGGDSQVCFRDNALYLNVRRIIPISLLAKRYPQILAELERLAKRLNGSARPLHEHLVLVKSIQGREHHYTTEERQLCGMLQQSPLGICQIADRLKIDVYALDTRRLEKEGVILRSGFTPTDAMVLKGEFQAEAVYQAAYAAAVFLHRCTGIEPEAIADEVYRLVEEKLYCNLVRILWNDEQKAQRTVDRSEELEFFAKQAFQRERAGDGMRFYKNLFATDAVLLGTGAPVHIFLPQVAEALHTTCRISEYSGVSNALGAVLGDVCVYETVVLTVDYMISNWDTESEAFVVYGDEREQFDTYEDAVTRAEMIARARAYEKAVACGAGEIYQLSCDVKKKEGSTNLGHILLGAEITACARGAMAEVE